MSWIPATVLVLSCGSEAKKTKVGGGGWLKDNPEGLCFVNLRVEVIGVIER